MTLAERLRIRWELTALDQERRLAADRIEALEKANLELEFGLREIIDADMRGEYSKMVEIAQEAIKNSTLPPDDDSSSIWTAWCRAIVYPHQG